MTYAIRVDNLSKIYNIGSIRQEYGTFYETFLSAVRQKLGKSSLVNRNSKVEEHESKLVIADKQRIDAPPGQFYALRDINIEIKAGDRIGLIGRNGSGKSTLLKILSRVTAPTQGSFRYRGKLVSLLEVGTGFHLDLSGRDNIYLNAAINGMSRKDVNIIFKEIHEFSELGEHIDTIVRRYSSGMYMRLAFSIASHLRSDILLLDEVLSVGDSGFQKHCREKMLEISGSGRTLILVSHDMAAVESICDKAIELSYGEVMIPKGHLAQERLLDSTLPAYIQSVRDAAKRYYYENESLSLVKERAWLATQDSGNEKVKLYGVCVQDDKNQVKDTFTTEQQITLWVDYEILIDTLDVFIAFQISDLAGHIIFVSHDNKFVPATSGNSPPRGRYQRCCTIPGKLLNNNTYKVDVLFKGSQLNIYYRKNEVVIFDVVEASTSADSVRGGLSGPWPEAAIRPELVWSSGKQIKTTAKKIKAPSQELVESH